MHLGLLTPDLSHRHGWAHYSLSMIRALQRAGIPMTIIAARSSPPLDDLPIHRLLPDVAPAERGLLLKSALGVARVRDLLGEATVIHATAEPYAPSAALIAGGRPYFVTAHGTYVRLLPGRRFPAGLIYARALRRAHLLCVSSYTASVARATLPGVRATVIPNGIDPARFAHLPPRPADAGGPLVLSVGAIKPRKGALELVRALALVRRTIPDVRCALVGNLDAMPDYVRRVRAEIDALGLADAVHLPGHVDEAALLGWYAAADVFALPSLNDPRSGAFEGYGLVHMEASATGLPVIGTRDSGAVDAIDDGVTGLLVPQAGVEAHLAEAICALLSDPARARRMGEAGRARAARQTWDHVATQTLAAYAAGS